MTPNNIDLLKYLADARSFYLPYHNHKEAMAWAGVVIFMVILGLVTSSMKGAVRSTILWPCLHKTLASVAIVIFAGIILCYIHEQFRLRSFAADINAACFILSAKILASPETNYGFDFTTKSLDGNNGTNKSEYMLPKSLLDQAKQLEGVGGQSRKTLEFLAYALMLFSLFVSITFIFIMEPGG